MSGGLRGEVLDEFETALADPRCTGRCKATWEDGWRLMSRHETGDVYKVQMGKDWITVKALPGRGFCPAHEEAILSVGDKIAAAIRANGQPEPMSADEAVSRLVESRQQVALLRAEVTRLRKLVATLTGGEVTP